MKKTATALLFLNPVLWASFYAVTKGALAHVDPVAFSTLELSIAALPAAAILFARTHRINKASIFAGLVMGGSLYLAVVGSTIALYFTTATNTAFFPALNGAFAALIIVILFRKKLDLPTWLACATATVGALVLISQSSQDSHLNTGDLIALAAALAYTIYIFVVDWQTQEPGKGTDLWVAFAVELLTMAVLGWIVFVVTGTEGIEKWTEPTVLWTALFIGIFTTVLPTAIALFFQHYVEPATVALLYVLEPIWGAIAAAALVGERLSLIGYIGGGLIVLGSLIKTIASLRNEPGRPVDNIEFREANGN